MKKLEDYWFKPTERINGLIYIVDGEGRFVTIDNKIKKFKTTTKAAEFIDKIERIRDFNIIKQEASKEKEK